MLPSRASASHRRRHRRHRRLVSRLLRDLPPTYTHSNSDLKYRAIDTHAGSRKKGTCTRVPRVPLINSTRLAHLRGYFALSVCDPASPSQLVSRPISPRLCGSFSSRDNARYHPANDDGLRAPCADTLGWLYNPDCCQSSDARRSICISRETFMYLANAGVAYDGMKQRVWNGDDATSGRRTTYARDSRITVGFELFEIYIYIGIFLKTRAHTRFELSLSRTDPGASEDRIRDRTWR